MLPILELLTEAIQHQVAWQVHSARAMIARHPDQAEREALTKLADAILESLGE